MAKYKRVTYPNIGDKSISDTPLVLPYDHEGKGKTTGDKVNSTKRVYPGGIPSSNPNRQKNLK